MALTRRASVCPATASSRVLPAVRPSKRSPLTACTPRCPTVGVQFQVQRGCIRAAASSQEYASELLDLHTSHAGPALETLEEHNTSSTQFFSETADRWSGSVPEEVQANVAAAIRTVPGLGPETRAVCILQIAEDSAVQALQAEGVLDILAVDASADRLSRLQGSSAAPSTCGNDLELRTWEGDITSLPDYLCRAELVVFCGSLGGMHSARDALLKSMMALKPGGHVLVCEPLGRSWQNQVAAVDPQHMPNALPDRAGLEELVCDLGLDAVGFKDSDQLYSVLLQLPPTRRFKESPLYIEGDVTYGFGRGSKQMGVPTANLPPEPLQDRIGSLPAGVYFGWAQLQSGKGADGEVHKMVMNIGYRPTCDDGGGLTVELHILHKYEGDFYGEPLHAVVLGYIRPEMRFPGLPALVARIKYDIGIANFSLDVPELAAYCTDPCFSS